MRLVSLLGRLEKSFTDVQALLEFDLTKLIRKLSLVQIDAEPSLLQRHQFAKHVLGVALCGRRKVRIADYTALHQQRVKRPELLVLGSDPLETAKYISC